MTQSSQPGWAAIAWIRAVVGCENSSDKILIEAQVECQIELLCDAGAAEAGIAALHFDNGRYHFLAWPFGSRPASITR